MSLVSGQISLHQDQAQALPNLKEGQGTPSNEHQEKIIYRCPQRKAMQWMQEYL